MSKVGIRLKYTLLLHIMFGIGISMLLPNITIAQQQPLTMEEAINIAMDNNLEIKGEELKLKYSKQNVSSAYDIGKTSVYYEDDAKSIAPNKLPIVVWGVQQTIKFPTKYIAKHKFLKQNVQVSERYLEIEKSIIKRDVSKKYIQVVFLKQKLKKQQRLDSLYTSYTKMVIEKFNAGEISKLEKTHAEYKRESMQLELKNLEEQLKHDKLKLQEVLNSSFAIDVAQNALQKLIIIPYDSVNNPLFLYYDDAIALKSKKLTLNKHKLLPDIDLTYFHGSNNGVGRNRFDGFKIGLSIPLWYGVQKTNIKTSKIEKKMLENEYLNTRTKLKYKYKSLLSDLNRYENELQLYNATGHRLQKELLMQAQASFVSGEISYIIFLQLFEQSNAIEIKYINSLFHYNLTALDINYLLD